ncbi:autotransporter assembly complex protein TamB [Vibrio japonicus]|uniref:Translocation/assembly module TamB n=1 Tax=Vibrio japonicus TaxID=1824638 RepID=A0ABY5LFT3_9VIBR|nr:translocation/assembly module TamB domain-containing protein [Vibrio japonicus]UUM30884.1 translocation/assembly module TamB [Vibrio japonicus]
MTKVVLKWSKWLSLSLLGILITLLLTVSFLLFTKAGLGMILWGGEKFVPQLKVGSYSGAIFPRFTLNDVEFVDANLAIDTKVDTLTLAINHTCFTEPSVCVDELAIDGLVFAMESTAPSEEPEVQEDPTPLGKITTPIPIKVSRVALTNIDLDILGNKIDWKSFTTGLIFEGNRLRISKTELKEISIALASSEATGEEPQPAPETQSTEAQAIELPDVELPLQVDVERLDIYDFELKQESPIVVHHLGLEATALGSDISIPVLELDMPQVEGKIDANVTLKEGYPLTLNVDALVKDEMANGQKISLTAQGSAADLSLDTKLSGLAKADLKAKLALLDPDLPFDISLKKVDAKWPLVGKGDYFVKVDKLETKGSLKGYSLNLDSEIKGNALPDLDLKVKGKGNLDQIELSSLTLETLGGSVAGDILVNWKQPINWVANLALNDIQPGLQWPESEGKVSGDVSTSGSLTEQGGWEVSVSKLDIDGILREYPLNIKGQLDASDVTGKGRYRVDTPGLVLSHGPNSIEAKGKLTDEWRMSLSLDLPNLAKSVPDLSGKAIGDVVLRGPMKEPNVKLGLDIDSIDFQNQAQVKHVTLTGNITPLPKPKGNVKLKVTGGSYQDYSIDDVLLIFSGEQSLHNLTLDLDSNLASANLALTGTLNDKPNLNWAGKLERVQLSSKQGDWRLNKPTSLGFDMATKLVSVAAHCWLQQDSSVCLDENIKVGESGEARLSVNQFNFDQIAAFIPKETELHGEANANVWAKWEAGKSPEAKVEVRLPSGGVSQKLPQTVDIGWDKITLDANLAGDRLDANWLIDVTDNGDFSGQVTLPNVLSTEQTLDGQIKLTTFNLDFLAPLIGEYSKLKSDISTDIALSGPILHPRANGQLLIDNILVQGDISPTQIDSGKLTVDLSGYEANLSAILNTPDGALNLEGDADWRDLSDWRTKLRVFAKELKVEMPPMVALKVVPDMTINASPKFAKIEGNIALPWGRIVVEEIPPSATGISSDQVLLDEDLKPLKEDSAIPFEVETDINIQIGNDVLLEAFGLKGGLVGNLNVTQKDKGPYVVGEVNIVDGSYRSFGQDLRIQEGKILMNGPVDLPYVQISAIRNPENTQDDVIAGVKVTGPATDPVVSIFSEPAMPQANALSYLLRGQDIDAESGGNAMTTALIGLSLAKSGRVVGALGEAFGVQDLQLDTAGSGDSSKVTVSGYLLPGLQVKYGVGIFDSVGEFTVRYRLMKDLYLEVVTGMSSAVDILYQFEFD